MAVDGTTGGRSPFHSLGITASGLSAQRARIETIVENIANAETTRTPDGGPYRRKVVRLVQGDFASVLEGGAGEPEGAGRPRMPRTPTAPAAPATGPVEETSLPGTVQVAAIEADTTPGPRVYDPGHPDADAAGFVEMPNVNITEEMVGLMESRRLYEANATVFDAVKQMLSRAARL